MGIESEQLVFDYLSRVGDLAQQRGLPSGARMRLVASLRARIDAQKADQKADSVPGVKRMLARLGTPEAVVQAAADEAGAAGAEGGGAPAPRPAPPVAAPVEPDRPAQWTAREKLGGLLGKVPAPRDGDAAEPGGRRPVFLKKRADPPADPPPPAAAPPHLATADELGDAEDPPDWWRVEAAPYGAESLPFAAEDAVPGFVGGIEIPEVWERPEDEDKDADGKGAKGAKGAGKDAASPGKDGGKDGGRLLPALVRRTLGVRRPPAPAEPEAGAEPAADAAQKPAPVPLRAWLSPVLTLAVLLLMAGAVLGSWLALIGGWGLAYVSHRLSRKEAKFAALGVPGLVAGSLIVWFWGRYDRRWGDRIAPGHLGPELLAGLPVAARVAAVASALFLLWRMRRSPAE
ncbi:hypothetical protein ACFU7T_24310 [Streptomyces sp. NPDC057555]|uniref:hypothetical protein n=1 Tax=Streptomyces sp. NPDC057555 TaxID=3346166 RepID=UPI00369409D1